MAPEQQLLLVLTVKNPQSLTTSSQQIYIDTTAQATAAEFLLEVPGLSPTGFVDGTKPIRILGTVKKSSIVQDQKQFQLRWESLGTDGSTVSSFILFFILFYFFFLALTFIYFSNLSFLVKQKKIIN